MPPTLIHMLTPAKEGLMKKILAINIDTITLNIVSSLLSEHTTDFEILTAEKVGELDDIAGKIKVDIALIDLVKPTPADIDVLKFVAQSHSRLPLMVMTAFETGEIETALKAIGPVRYFEKPVDFKTLADRLFDEMKSGVGGAIHGISLASFLQMSEMERTSCTLRIKTEDKKGHLFLVKGALIAAETDSLSGEEAVFEILSWSSPSIEIENAVPDRKKEITVPLMTLLMEGLKRKDEKAGKNPKKGKIAIQKAAGIPVTPAGEKLELEAAATEGPQDKAAKKKPTKEQKDAPPPDEEAQPAALETLEQLRASGKITDASKVLRRKRRISLTFKIVVVILVLLILACLWFFEARPWLVKHQYEQALTEVQKAGALEKKLAALDAYITTHPDSPYRSAAEKQKLNVAREMEIQAFDTTLQQAAGIPIDSTFEEKALALYNGFLEKYPESVYAEEIRKRIADIPAIMKDAEYGRLQQIPKNDFSARIAAYKAYIEAYPKGENTQNVRRMLSDLGEDFYAHIVKSRADCDNEKNRESCIKLCKYFTRHFPNHPRTAAVEHSQALMEGQAALEILMKKVKEAGSNTMAVKGLYQDFLKTNPDSPVRKTVAARLAAIETVEGQKKEWEQTLAYIQDSRNSIFDRTARMRRYVEANPSPAYRKDAQELLAWLEAEEAKVLQTLQQQQSLMEQQQEKQEQLERMRGEIRKKLSATKGRYLERPADCIFDTQTKLTWAMLDSSAMAEQCMDYKTAAMYVKNLKTGGYADWRLPKPNELLVIYNDRPAFPAAGAPWYWTSEVFSAAWHQKVNTVKRTAEGTWEKAEMDLEQCGAVRAVRP